MLGVVFMAAAMSSAMAQEGLFVKTSEAKPEYRQPPPLAMYYHCVDKDNFPADGALGNVDVRFDVNADGNPENVVAASSTDQCLEMSAVAVVKRWKYEPAYSRGVPQREEGLTVSLAYVLAPDAFQSLLEQGVLPTDDREPKPMLRVPPQEADFKRCIHSDLFRIERVVTEFEVMPDGETANMRYVSATKKCYANAAMLAVDRWLYAPAIKDGEPVLAENIRTTIEFQVGRK